MTNLHRKLSFLFCLGAGSVFAAHTRTEPMTVRNQGTTVITDDGLPPSHPRTMRIGMGVQKVVTVGGASINEAHVSLEVAPRMWVGLGFGFDADFYIAGATGDFRYDFARSGPAGLFFQGKLGYARLGLANVSENGFAAGFLLGADYALTEALHLSAAYGLELLFASHDDNHIGFTQGSPLGNFGIHWYF